MLATLQRIPPKYQMLDVQVTERLGHLHFPFTQRVYNRVTAIMVNEAFDEALVEFPRRGRCMEWLVSKRFPAIPKSDLIWLNQIVSRAMRAEVEMYHSAIASAQSMAREARESVFGEVA